MAFSPFLLPSPSSSSSLVPVVVIQKFCYHGNTVTSHFSIALLSKLSSQNLSDRSQVALSTIELAFKPIKIYTNNNNFCLHSTYTHLV